MTNNSQYLLHIYHKLLDAIDNAAAAKSLQSCLTLCDLIDGSPPGSRVPGILQARTLEWVGVRPSATPWTAAYQAPPSMGFSRQEYWSGVPLPSPIGRRRVKLREAVGQQWQRLESCGAKSKGMWAAPRSWKRQRNGFAPAPPEGVHLC